MGEYGAHQENGLTRRKEDRLYRKAALWATQGIWNLSEKNRETIRDRLNEIVETGDNNRDVIQSAKVLVDCQKQDVDIALKMVAIDSDKPTAVTNQQINIYLPSNGREAITPPRVNGHSSNGNGKH